jgi:hypothetical protein
MKNEIEKKYESFLNFPEEQSIYVEVPIKFDISNLEHTGEEEIFQFVKEIYHGRIVRHYNELYDRKDIVDLYFPDIGFAIDFHSLECFSENALRKRGISNPSHYLLNKWLIAKSRNVRLIQIFSDEWLFRKDICKKILKNVLKPTSKPIPARKCFVSIVEPSEARKFYNRHHLQDFAPAIVHLGLYHGDEIIHDLVSVASFSKSRLGIGSKPAKDNNIWELTRYAIKGDVRVIGGFEKILKNFIKMNFPNSIYTFIDNRWFTGESLERSNFVKEYDYYGPGYWYTKDFYTRKHRFSFRKDLLIRRYGHLIDNIESWSEKMITGELGFSKIYDCGHSKWWYFVNS